MARKIFSAFNESYSLAMLSVTPKRAGSVKISTGPGRWHTELGLCPDADNGEREGATLDVTIVDDQGRLVERLDMEAWLRRHTTRDDNDSW